MYTVKICKGGHGPGPPQSQKVQCFCEKGPGFLSPPRTGYAQNLFNSCKTCDNIIKYIYTESFIRLFVFHNYFCNFFATLLQLFQILVTIFDNL